MEHCTGDEFMDKVLNFSFYAFVSYFKTSVKITNVSVHARIHNANTNNVTCTLTNHKNQNISKTFLKVNLFR